MKNLIKTAVIIIVLLIMPASCIGQAKVFKSVASMTGVESVYIGPAAMRFAQDASVLDSDKVSADAIKSIKSLEVIDCDEPAYIPAVADEAQKIINELKLDVILETKEEDEECTIYGRVPEENADYIESLLIVSREEDSFSLVYINGKISLEELLEDYK